MFRLSSAILALSLAAGTAGAANLKVLSADCDPSLATIVGLGVPGKICTAATSRSNAGRVKYGASDGAFYPLGQGEGIVFDADPGFLGKSRADEARNGNGSADAPQVLGAANRASPGSPASKANSRSQAVGGGMPAAFPGNGLALGRTGQPGNGLPPFVDLPSDIGTAPDLTSATPEVASIPLPAAGWLLLGGLGALGLLRRRKMARTT